jgi:acetyltransferase-like isoleucine patch superfamily enzyme
MLTQFIKHRFYNFGKSKIIFPFKTKLEHMISIGDGTIINKYGWIQGQNVCNKDSHHDGLAITIGNNCYIGHHVHIIGSSSIIIEDNVLIADRVFLQDCSHSWEDVTTPIKDQPIKFIGEIKIKSGSWIGENVTILPRVTIGKNSIVGANSVVTKSVPDYSIAVGNPAKIIKNYNFENKKWEKI